jgi:hypothetical protein
MIIMIIQKENSFPLLFQEIIKIIVLMIKLINLKKIEFINQMA